MKHLAKHLVARVRRPNCRQSIVLAVVLSLACQCVGPFALCGRAAEATGARHHKGRRQAILIGIENYRKTTPLRHAGNDVRQLAMTLRERGSYEVVEIIDTARESDSQSESAAMQAKVKGCLEKLGTEDDVLLYFTGHGFRDKDGKLYLAQIDCDPASPAPGGIPVAWLREQLAACKAKFKLLIIDACHGGSEKGEDQTAGVTAKDLGMPFRNLASVVTLASSQHNEKSLVWHEKRQSLFSYWVNQGLKGHADQNGNGEVTIDELYDFVFRNVTDVADRYFKCKQTPARIVRSPGVPVVISLNPHTLKGVLDDMAEQLATAMHLRELSKVGVPEFSVDMGPRELLGGKFGSMGRYCAVELERCLIRKSAGKFDVVEHDALQEVLGSKGFTVKDLRTSAVKDLTVEGEHLPVIARGTLRNRTGRVVTMQCKLVGLEGQRNFGISGGKAALNESEWGMLDRSAYVPIPDAPSVDAPEPPDAIEVLDRESERAHPGMNPDFPYPVQIMVGKEERKGVVRGNQVFVPLRKGEVYWIRVENRDPAKVYMRLLVDGRSTLPEKVQTKEVTVEPKTRPVVYRPAQRVNLDEARYWHLEPNGVYGIQGFFSKLGKDGAYNEFEIADAPDSLSARERFGEQLGLITAAFYAPKGGARNGPPGLMTKPGKERKQKLRMYKTTEVGNLLAVVNIHYVAPEALDKLLDEKRPPGTE